MRWLLLLVLLGVAACGEDAEPKDPLDGLDPDVRCYAEDGLWECADEAMTEDCRCAARAGDAGRPCVDSTGCELLCVYVSGGCGTLETVGECQAHETLHACYDELFLGGYWPPEEPVGQLRECRSSCD